MKTKEEIKQTIISMRSSGESLRAIGKAVGLSGQGVLNIINSLSLDEKPVKLDKIKHLHEQGLPTNEIAKVLGRRTNSVCCSLNRLGLKNNKYEGRRKRWAEGMSDRQLAEHEGVSIYSIVQWRNHNNLARNKGSKTKVEITDEMRDKVLSLRGESICVIARKVLLSTFQVKKILNDSN